MAGCDKIEEQINDQKERLLAKRKAAGWLFLIPAAALIAIMAFWPIIQAFIMSLKTGSAANMQWANPWFYNYKRMFQDRLFKTAMTNTFLYLIVQVPVMLVLAMLLAQILNNKDLKFKGLFRTMVFLPCATSLVSYSLIFKSLFATQGLINTILVKLGILSGNFNFLGTTWSARLIIILALLWRWTGYNMVFYLAGLQNIDYSVYEAARIDGANRRRIFWKITVPLLKPTIVMTVIMSINGTLQLFDESVNLTSGGPANTTITMSHYIYNSSFGQGTANFGYATAMSFFVLLLVAILSFISMKAGDKQAVLALFICSLAGFGFELYHDKAKDRLFGILLLAMMVPQVATMIPLFRMISKMKLLNTVWAFILPSISTPFLIMMFRQNSRNFPTEIMEAARVDGVSEFGIFWKIYMPIMKATYAAAAVITFMNAWNSYLWPKVVMTDNRAQTMPMLIANLSSGYVTDYGELMMGVLFCSVPTMVIFFILQKQFAEGITGSVK